MTSSSASQREQQAEPRGDPGTRAGAGSPTASWRRSLAGAGGVAPARWSSGRGRAGGGGARRAPPGSAVAGGTCSRSLMCVPPAVGRAGRARLPESLGRRRRSRDLSGRLSGVPATILDGKATAAAIRAELTDRVRGARRRRAPPRPRHAARRRRSRAAAGTSARSTPTARRSASPASSGSCPPRRAQADVLAVVAELNADPACTGYIVQLPLPRQVDEYAVLEAMDPAKDADGLHPTNLGRLVLNVPGPLPCTPVGHRRAAAPLRRADRRRGGRRRRPRDHRGPAARPAAHPALGERDRDPLPHRHPRPGRARAHAPTSSSPPPGVPGLITGAMVKPGAAVLDVGREPRGREDRRRRRSRRPGRRRARRAEPGRRRADDPGDAAAERGPGGRAGRGTPSADRLSMSPAAALHPPPVPRGAAPPVAAARRPAGRRGRDCCWWPSRTGGTGLVVIGSGARGRRAAAAAPARPAGRLPRRPGPAGGRRAARRDGSGAHGDRAHPALRLTHAPPLWNRSASGGQTRSGGPPRPGISWRPWQRSPGRARSPSSEPVSTAPPPLSDSPSTTSSRRSCSPTSSRASPRASRWT